VLNQVVPKKQSQHALYSHSAFLRLTIFLLHSMLLVLVHSQHGIDTLLDFFGWV
jgi:hypothetical protein